MVGEAKSRDRSLWDLILTSGVGARDGIHSGSPAFRVADGCMCCCSLSLFKLFFSCAWVRMSDDAWRWTLTDGKGDGLGEFRTT